MAKSFNQQMLARFKNITTSYNKINTYIHETAMLIITHASEHGDCSTAQGLVNAMPQSARKAALLAWFAKYTPIVVKDNDKWQAKMHKPDSKLFVAWDIEGASANPWYTIAEEMGSEKVFSFDDILKIGPAADARRILKQIENGHVAPEAVEAATAYANYLATIKVPDFTHVKANDTEDNKLFAVA